MEGKKYKAIYRNYIVSENTHVRRNENLGSISFENLGTVGAVLNKSIPLDNTGIARTFSEKPYVSIDTDFSIIFSQTADPNAVKKILVIETYYKPI